jgi:hypothetical protein
MSSPRQVWRALVLLYSANLLLALPQEALPANVPTPANRTSASHAELSPLPQDATQYVREVVRHQIAANDDDHSHWRYRIHREDEKGSQDRDVIDTKEGQLARTLAVNGQPLTPEQRASDDARMKKLVQDPAERAKREKRAKDDNDKATQMFKAIPDAFIFKYDGEEGGQIRLTFLPNPHYDAPNRELQVFRAMGGQMWIDRSAERLTRMEGTLFEDVTFGWGLLGRLNKGGTFSVAQSNVGDNHWEIVALDVKMSGHAVIFKTINVKQMQRLTEFRRVSDNLTIAEAYQLLTKPEAVSAESRPRGVKTQGKN